MRKIAYIQLIAALVKVAFNFKETILKPVGDFVELYVNNQNVGHQIPIGKIKIDPDFVDFIQDGQYTTKVLPLDRVDEYMRMGSFQIDNNPENSEALARINKNFDTAKAINTEQVLQYLKERRPLETAYTATFRKKDLGLETHDKTLEQFTGWLSRRNTSPSIQLNQSPQGT